jgi:prephenate dehydratase
MMRVGYLGPAGTYTEEALLASAPDGVERVPLPSIRAAVLAVQEGAVDRAVVPIENSIEGSVNATLDALATEAPDVTIVGEVVHAIRHCLIAREELALADIGHVASHPQAIAQCARFLREELPQAEVVAAASTADAVRLLSERVEPRWAALANRLAADLYGARVLREDVQDQVRNHTRFVWLAPVGAEPMAHDRRWKTSVVFWGGGDATPGWLVRCLAELSDRGVNMTRIESRPRRMGLGQYMFFVDVDGRDTVPPVSEALAALAVHCEGIRTLGSYPAAS